jgi:hypothetical protein
MTPKRHDEHKAGKNILLSRYRRDTAAREIAAREHSLDVVIKGQKPRDTNAAQFDLFAKQLERK